MEAEVLERALAQASPAGLATIASNGKWVSAPHLRMIDDLILRLASGEVSRAMVNLPPRHGKSELLSVYTPAWYLGNFPDRRVILASYESDFAAQWGRRAKSVILEFGDKVFSQKIRIDPESSASSRWDIYKRRGGMQTSGIGGPLTGKGAHLAIVDDPVKNHEEAASRVVRDSQWEWFKSTFYTRLEPGGAIIIIMTRWHEDDLGGRIIQDMRDGGEKWEILSLPAIAESNNDPLGRKIGDPLWPARYPSDKLEEIRRTLGSYWFAGLYQQRPAPLEGGMFKRDWFEVVSSIPRGCEFVRRWDLSATEGRGDWTAGMKLGEFDGYYYITDIRRVQEGPAGVEKLVKSTAEIDGYDTSITMEQEPGSSGVNTIDYYARKVLPGFDFHGVRSTGSKIERARPVSAAAEAGLIKILRGEWNHAFLDEITIFPNGKNDDQVDVLSGAFLDLAIRGISRGDVATEDEAFGELMGDFDRGEIPGL
jgi:predicted phage terminase large subunit-like protein